jgi:Peptidase family M49
MITGRRHEIALLLVGSAICALPGAGAAESPAAPATGAPLPDARALKQLATRLAPVDLNADVDRLPANERAALALILRAAQIMEPLFRRQVWAGNEALLSELVRDSTPLGRERLHAFQQNQGPWLRLDQERPFLPAVGDKPPSANFYPADATKQELEVWMKGLPVPMRTLASGFFTTIRRGTDGQFTIIPYSVEYQGELARAAELLREAAARTTQPTLKHFLETRAAAFRSNDYYASDVAWMQLDASIEPTIGPYEVYEDGWFSAKAAFEAFVTLRDDAETQKLARFRTWRTICPSPPRCATGSWARWRPSAWSTRSTALATPTVGYRRPRSTCPTTRRSRSRWGPSG